MPFISSKNNSNSSTAHKSTKKSASTPLSTLQYSITDVVSTLHHSTDFIQTRNIYVIERLRLMILFFALTVPASAVFDYLLFPTAQADLLLFNRVILSLSLMVLAIVIQRRTTINTTRLVLVLAFSFPMLFYVATTLSFEANLVPAQVPLSFSMLPFLTIAMLGLFPLTICGGLFLLSMILVPMFTLDFALSSSYSISLIDKLWLFLMFGGISLWLQTGQLVMLMKLYRESTVDPLTGLMNRRVLMRQLEQVSSKAKQQSNLQPDLQMTSNTVDQINVSSNILTPAYSAMMFDLDHFKRINDTYGHIIGDRVLVLFAKILQRELRHVDIIARVGGEEFFIVMPAINQQQALHIAQRISAVVRQTTVESNAAEQVQVTVSVGVTAYHEGESVSQLFNRVDELLYQAKALGRDTVVCDESLITSSPALKAS